MDTAGVSTVGEKQAKQRFRPSHELCNATNPILRPSEIKSSDFLCIASKHGILSKIASLSRELFLGNEANGGLRMGKARPW
jgi:hypothetical protein